MHQSTDQRSINFRNTEYWIWKKKDMLIESENGEDPLFIYSLSRTVDKTSGDIFPLSTWFFRDWENERPFRTETVEGYDSRIDKEQRKDTACALHDSDRTRPIRSLKRKHTFELIHFIQHVAGADSLKNFCFTQPCLVCPRENFSFEQFQKS